MASGLNRPEREALLRWLARLVLFLCLGAWLTVRFWVPLSGRVQARFFVPAALAVTAAGLYILVRFDMVERFFLPWGPTWKTALAGGVAFLLGGLFDISYAMPHTDGALIVHPLFRALCHAGNGILFAIIVLALLRAGRDLKGIAAGVGWRQMAVIFLALNAITLFYAFTSKTVYYWDNAGYWTTARSLAAQSFGYGHLRGILETVIDYDYNYLPALPISLLMRLLGESRMVYLLGVSNFCTLPALWGLAVMAKDNRWGGAVLMGLFPMLIFTGLAGFVDTISAAFAIWAFVIYFSDRPAVSRGICTGALLIATFLFRRYFFFFAASFGVAALLQKLLFERKKWADFLALFLSCAVGAFYFTYVFLLRKVVATNYGDLYSAYALGLGVDFKYLCRYFGLAVLVLIFLFALLRLGRREDRPRMVFCLTQILVCFGAFVSVQSHGLQHLLLYLPALAMLAVTALWAASELLSMALAAACTLCCFLPAGASAPTVGGKTLPHLLPSVQYYGSQRGDIDQLLALADFVDGLSAQEPHTAVVMASSFTFNCETLMNLRPSLGLREPQVHTTIQYHATVDKRDAFNWNTPTADYMIVGDPVQVHLGEENQRVVTILAYDVLEGVGPGTAYEALPETFSLEGGVTVRIYRRVRDWTYEEYRSVSDRLQAYYPDYAELYRLPDWLN